MIERQLSPDFSIDVQREIETMQMPCACNPAIAKDLRDKLWFSIDNDDSKDLDQLSYAEELDAQRMKLYIAIADVDCLVKKDSAIDQHAQQNTTSVYTPTKIFSMLPEKLSTNLTSLNENEDRLAVVVEMTVSTSGKIEDYKLYSACVRNKAKLSYRNVSAWLGDKRLALAPLRQIDGLEKQILLHERLSDCLRDCRQEQGALTLETQEIYPVVDRNQVVAIKVELKNPARQLIEDCMIAANIATACFLSDQQLPLIKRVVKTPKRWDRIVAIAKQYGETLPDTPNAKALDLFLIKRRLMDPMRFPNLSLTVIKLLGRGEYIVEHPHQESEGHFSLAIKHYTHSTAPNRRYADLIAQRFLKSVFLRSSMPYTNEELERLAKRCTDKEDDAAKVERKMKKSRPSSLFCLRESMKLLTV